MTARRHRSETELDEDFFESLAPGGPDTQAPDAQAIEDGELAPAPAASAPAAGAGPAAPANLDDVMAAMGHWSSDASISLDPNAPPPAPRFPRLPLVDEGDQRARAARMSAEQMLTSDEWETSHRSAADAMNLLLEVPPAERGQMIDQLDPAAFENLLARVPVQQREQLAGLVESASDPERRLRLWAESHKSRAGNEVTRRQGDIGEKGSRSEEQKQTRRRHKRRRRAAKETGKEVDREVAILLEQAEAGDLDLAAVDALRERKDLEHSLELEHNINITNETDTRADGSQIVWSAPELQRVGAVLERLPDAHARDPKGFNELRRTESEGGSGAVHVDNEIRVADEGADETETFRHGGDPREMVSDEVRGRHGDNVSTLEFVLTHEIGHNVEERHDEAFDKFKAAAGWDLVSEVELSATGLTAGERGLLKSDQSYRAGSRMDITDGDTTYRAAGGDRYHSRHSTSIPERGEATGGVLPDSWAYARASPVEHFAETYAKAVHVPERLHADLVELPAKRLEEAQTKLAAAKRAMEMRKRDRDQPHVTAAELQGMTDDVIELEGEVAVAERAATERGEQFRIMRNDVFGTDKAVEAAVERLRARGATAEAIAAFEERAARASTPEQVEHLESRIAH